MHSILTNIGLSSAKAGEQIPNHASGLIITNWALAYFVFSSRLGKRIAGIDNNTAPRDDLSKYGDAAVQSGKISRDTLEKLRRNEAASANSIEGFALFTAGILLAVHAGVPSQTINGLGVWYTVARIAYVASYIVIDTEPLSWLRSVAWWSCNIPCITALVMAGKKL